MNKKIKCDIYTRVSTTMQVDGYSLDAQKEKLKRYAEFQNMEIVNEYSDEGKSGKSVEGRPEFQRMLDNIENGTDEVQFVLVFKLSRFGRNAADVLNSLQRMQDFGVNLICVEDGIDSSKDSGKLMISVLSAVAEIERENILVQTMEGRKQKAREGKWNGGFAPYGYELVNGELQIAEDEAEIIRLIYDKFIHTNMGISAIAAWLNQHGYKKKKRQNNTLDAFAASFIKGVLDNPVYCGKLAYGRRKNEKVSGTRNEYRIVKQENYMLHDGIHEGIVSETDWELAHQKREKTGVKYEKTHSLDHEHILSGILRCPLCGSGMYGNVNRKKKKDAPSRCRCTSAERPGASGYPRPRSRRSPASSRSRRWPRCSADGRGPCRFRPGRPGTPARTGHRQRWQPGWNKACACRPYRRRGHHPRSGPR